MSSNTNNAAANWPALVAIAILGWEFISPDINYMLIRLVILIASIYYASRYNNDTSSSNYRYISWLFIAVAILFNPLFIITLERSMWQLVDVITVIIFIYAIYNPSRETFASLYQKKNVEVESINKKEMTKKVTIITEVSAKCPINTIVNNHFSLLTGINSTVEKYIAKSPQNKPALALSELLNSYQDRFDKNGKLLGFISNDTRRFMFESGYKDIFTPTYNVIELKKLSPSEQESKKIHGIFDKIDDALVEFMIVGYYYRIQPTMRAILDDKLDLTVDITDSPGRAVERLYDKELADPNSKFEYMFQDGGFGMPMLNGGGIDPVQLLTETINKNITKEFPMIKLLNKEEILFFMSLGWCLARFDIVRNKLKP